MEAIINTNLKDVRRGLRAEQPAFGGVRQQERADGKRRGVHRSTVSAVIHNNQVVCVFFLSEEEKEKKSSVTNEECVKAPPAERHNTHIPHAR